jgi:RimJ/RimL family protein N-acetyltransferase
VTVPPSPARRPPDPPLIDDAVLLRVPCEDDAPAIAAACADPEIARWVPIPVPYTLADARDFLAVVADGWTSGAHATFAIEDRANGTLAGMIGLDRGTRPGRASVGYWLAPRARGRGLVTRAVRLLAAWAFEDPALERLELMTLVGNDASGRVAIRSGFRREGILRRHLPFRGRNVDAVMYAAVREDRLPPRPAATPAASAGLPAALDPANRPPGDPDDPAAAAGGGAESLPEALDAWDRASAAVGALAGVGGPAATPLAAEILDTLREEVARRAADPPFLGPADAADRWDAVRLLLERLGLPEPAEPARTLVALGWDGNEVDDMLAPFGPDEARLVVATWLAASARVRLLLAGRAPGRDR